MLSLKLVELLCLGMEIPRSLGMPPNLWHHSLQLLASAFHANNDTNAW